MKHVDHGAMVRGLASNQSNKSVLTAFLDRLLSLNTGFFYKVASLPSSTKTLTANSSNLIKKGGPQLRKTVTCFFS